METVGVLLAAGAGRRMGQPKALVLDGEDVPWVVRSARILRAGGCSEIAVVVGAAADQVTSLLAGEDVQPIFAPDWQSGMAASLRTGLTWAAGTEAAAALIHLVDLPDVGPPVIRRLLSAPTAPTTLIRAGYDGRAGHPVLMGRAHWEPAAAAAAGDRGAGSYLERAGCTLIACEDLASGLDRDEPLAPGNDTPHP